MAKGTETTKERGYKHTPIHIKNETHESMKAYSDLFGTPLGRIAEEAISDWLATVGRARMEAVQKISGKQLLGNLVQMPVRSAAPIA